MSHSLLGRAWGGLGRGRRACAARTAAVALILAAAASAPAFAQEATLLGDIQQSGSGHSDPDGVVISGALWFAATDATHGRELWTSDGTPEGTVLVCDLAEGATSSSPSGFVDHDGKVWFLADGDGDGARTLWHTEFRGRGVTEVPMPPTSQASAGVTAGPFVADGLVYFATVEPSGRHAVWATDGRSEPTLVFGTGVDAPRFVTEADGHGLMVLDTGAAIAPVGIWRTDGRRAPVQVAPGWLSLSAWRVGSLGGRTVVSGSGVRDLGGLGIPGARVWISDGAGGLPVLQDGYSAESGGDRDDPRAWSSAAASTTSRSWRRGC